MASSLFEELGGEAELRKIIDRFVDRLFDDVMIGFFFSQVSRERLREKEYEFAARHLGAGVVYTGRPLGQAHGQHRIFGGQFMRRLQILKETLKEHQVPERVYHHWVEHTLKLLPQIVTEGSSECAISPE